MVLTRQFRFPVFTHGHDGYLIEAAAGLLDNASPESADRCRSGRGERLSRDACRTRLHRLYEPRLRHRKTLLFIAEYQADDRRGDGGGLAAEGEDIEVLEWPLTRALQAIRDGEIMDAKTIILLQHLALNADTLLAG